MNLTSVLMVIILRMGNVEAQTSVNANWRLNFGSPDTISWSSSQTDNFGNIFVVGSTIVPNEGSNIYVNKVSRYGSVIWEYNYNGLSSGYDYGIGITIDNSGRIFVVGTSYTNSQNGYDITTISLSPNGTLNWVQLYNGTGNGPDLGTAIKCDLDGDIIVIGTSNESGNDQDYKIIKYNTLGSQEWDANYDYNNLSDISVSLEINSNNEILVTGASSETNNQWDIATALFNEDGVLINVRREPASGLGISRPTSVSKDLYGHFYITGITLNSSGNFDIRTV